MRKPLTVCLVAGLLFAGCGEQDKGDEQTTTPKQAASVPATAPATPPKDEPEKAPEPEDAALRDFRVRMQTLVRLCLAKDDAAAIESVRSLLLPEAPTWFLATFGEEHARALALEYAPWILRLPDLPSEVRRNAAAGKTELLVERFERSDDEMATTFQAIALRKMKTKLPLYSMRLVEPGDEDGWHLWSFAWVDGKVRFIGRLMALTPIAADPDLAERASLRKKVEKELRLGK
jgi:hypothetical protein